MNFRNFNKKQYLVLISIAFLSLIFSSIFLNQLGIKDTVTFFIGTFLLITEIYLIRIDKKLSVLLFIISFPIIVTARKVCDFNFLIFKVTYETIYITLIFIYSLSNVKKVLKEYLKEKNSAEFKFTMLIILFIIFAYNSSIFSVNFYDSITETYISVLIPIMFMFVVISSFRFNEMKKIFYALIISIDLSCIYGFLQIFLYRIPIKAIKSNREFLTFGYHNVNIFASILMMIMPFLLQIIFYEKKTIKEKIILAFSLVINIAALLLTFTRGAWLSFIILMLLILLSKKYRKIIYIFIIPFIAIAKPLISFILKRGTNTSILNNESAIARVQSIFTSVRIMFEYPFGTGPKTFAEVYKNYLDAGYMIMPQQLRWNINVANYALENAHNLWLQIGVELGLVCLLIFLLLVINRFKVAFNNHKYNRGTLISLVMFLIFTVLTGFEFNHKGVITNNLILWLVFAMIQVNSGYDTKEESC